MDYEKLQILIDEITEISEYINYKDSSIPNKLKKMNKKIKKEGIESIIERNDVNGDWILYDIPSIRWFVICIHINKKRI